MGGARASSSTLLPLFEEQVSIGASGARAKQSCEHLFVAHPLTPSAFLRTLGPTVNRSLLSMLCLALAACPDAPKPPPPTPPPVIALKQSPAEKAPLTLGPLSLTLPGGFTIVHQTSNTVLLRHISDLTATVGISGKTDAAKDEKTIGDFLAGAQAQLSTLTGAKVSPATRTMPNSSRVLRGVVAHTVDRRGTPVDERREMWVFSDGPLIVTVSFIYIEDAASAAHAVDAVLGMVRDSIDAVSGPAQ